MRARPGGLALGVLCFGGGGLGFAEEGEEDLELAGGEAFLGGAVAGGAEGVEEAGSEVDFASKKAARGLLATVGEVGHSKVLLELVHNNENLNETIGPEAGIRIKEKFILCIESPARPKKESHGKLGDAYRSIELYSASCYRVTKGCLQLNDRMFLANTYRKRM